jgi:hypothetical protein
VADELLRDGDYGFAKGAEAGLAHNRIDLSPVTPGRLVQRDAVEPVDFGVGGESGDRVSSDIEVGNIILGGVRRKPTTRTVMLSPVLKANCLGIVQVEVRLCLLGKQKSYQGRNQGPGIHPGRYNGGIGKENERGYVREYFATLRQHAIG